jgi:hypothetical protein
MSDLLTLAIFGGGITLVIYSRIIVDRARRSQYWPSTQGRVMRSEVVRGGHPGHPRHEAAIEYTYAVDREYRSNTICIGGTVDTTRKTAEARCQRYPVAASVEVFYEPSNPATACLQRTAEGAQVIGLIGYGFVIFAALSLSGILTPR